MLKRRTDRKEKRQERKNRKGCAPYLVCGLLFLFGIGGCGNAQEETRHLVVAQSEEAREQYSLIAVSVGDVLLTQQVRCSYQQVKQEEISFQAGGKPVAEVYVTQGEQVEKGQLLAELGDSGISDRIEELEYRIARNQILLDQIQPNEDYEISTLWLQYFYRSNQTQADGENLEKNIKRIQTNYEHQRREYEDEIYLDNLELEELREEAADSRVYAGMDGTVSWIKSGLAGTLSAEGEVVIRLSDSSECLFASGEMQYRDLFSEGVMADMTISYGDYRGDYRLLPYQMDQWEDRMLFSVAEEMAPDFEVGTNGTIRIVLDKREGVLNVPRNVLHTADGKSFVYCLDEAGMREVKWVETGLYGDDRVEILSGLAEGDRIIQ